MLATAIANSALCALIPSINISGEFENPSDLHNQSAIATDVMAGDWHSSDQCQDDVDSPFG